MSEFTEGILILQRDQENGIEKAYVEKLIGEKIESNFEFLLNKNLVQLFINNYISRVPSYRYPKANIYFMASELHPNTLAKEIQHDIDYGDGDYYEMIHNVNEYQWLSSIESLIDQITKSSESV